MKGGVRTPPMETRPIRVEDRGGASMKGGVRTPPMSCLRLGALTREYESPYEGSPRDATKDG